MFVGLRCREAHCGGVKEMGVGCLIAISKG